MSDDKNVNEVAKLITQEWADKGFLIEGGFRAMVSTMGLPGIAQGTATIPELRRAYYAGAQHLFASIMRTMDPGSQETEADLRRMDLINKELEGWVEEEKKRAQENQ